MDKEIGYQHTELANGKWGELCFAEQMGNIGSEVSRSLRWFDKNPKRFQASFDRALELIDLSIAGTKKPGQLKELCRAREELCDYFNGNSWGSDPSKIQRYYDQFVMLVR